MIPKFKTYLNESVWSDIRKKSLGQEERIENSIDSMTIQEFYHYWKDRYEIIDKNGSIQELQFINHPVNYQDEYGTPIERTHNDGFSFTYTVEMVYNYKKNEIVEMRLWYFSQLIADYPNLRDVLGKEYDIDEDGVITVKYDIIKFHHYIDIIDKLLGIVKKPYVKIVDNK